MSYENVKKCSKCYSQYVGLKVGGYESSCGDHEHFFKKNGKLFCVNCLMAEGCIKCGKCRKLISRYDELGIWRRSVGLWDDHTADADTFGNGSCWCRKCSAETKTENNPKSSYSGWGPGNPEWEKQKWCRIAGCPYKVTSYPELGKFGTCAFHLKKCQGTLSSRYGGERQCDIAIPIDGGDFCQGCNNQTETFQQRKTRLATENERKFEDYQQVIQQAQNWWVSLSNEEQQREIHRLEACLPARIKEFWNKRGQENVKEQVQGNAAYPHWDRFENGKLYRDDPTRVPWAIVDEFEIKEFGISLSQAIGKDDNDNKNNLPSPNPDALSSQSINNNLNDKSGNSVSPSNSPYPSHGQEKLLEVKSNDNERPLIINLKNVKWIKTTTEGNLVVWFDNNQENNYRYRTQTITPDQVNNSQELQAIRNYCQESGKISLNQQELNSVIGTHSSPPQNTNPNNNSAWVIGIAIAVIFGLATGLFLGRKRKIKKN